MFAVGSGYFDLISVELSNDNKWFKPKAKGEGKITSPMSVKSDYL